MRGVLTARDTGARLAEQPPLTRQAGVAGLPSVTVSTRVGFQRSEGFGGAFTEAAAVNWLALDAAGRRRPWCPARCLVRGLWRGSRGLSRTAAGSLRIGVQAPRIHVRAPVVYRLRREGGLALTVTLDDGSVQTLPQPSLPAHTSAELFRRSGRIRQISLEIPAAALLGA